MEENPFAQPKQRFSITNNARLQEFERRHSYNALSIYEKGPKRASTREVVKSNILPSRREARRILLEKSHQKARAKMMEYMEQEGLSTYVAKKREMCLKNMKLKAKQAEMKLIEERVRLKEEALQKSQAQLEEDGMRFDAFLQEIDAKVQTLDKELEEEERLIAEREVTIKCLQEQIREEKQKCKDLRRQVQIGRKYKNFLGELTPPEHAEANSKKREAEVKAIIQVEPCLNPDDIEIEEIMYFTRPEQLREIFNKEEESNLFSMQNLQENEDRLEHVRRIFEKSKTALESKVNHVGKTVGELRKKLAMQNAKSASVPAAGVDEEDRVFDPRRLLRRISEHVNIVYRELLPPGVIASNETLDQIKDIEIWADKLMLRADAMRPEERSKAEKMNELKKRKQNVQRTLEEKRRMIEERKQKAVARMNTTLKQPGKMLMRRSAPLRSRGRSRKQSAGRKGRLSEEAKERQEAAQYKKFFTIEDT